MGLAGKFNSQAPVIAVGTTCMVSNHFLERMLQRMPLTYRRWGGTDPLTDARRAADKLVVDALRRHDYEETFFRGDDGRDHPEKLVRIEGVEGEVGWAAVVPNDRPGFEGQPCLVTCLGQTEHDEALARRDWVEFREQRGLTAPQQEGTERPIEAEEDDGRRLLVWTTAEGEPRYEQITGAQLRRRVFRLLSEDIPEERITLWRPAPLNIRIGVNGG